MKRFVSIQKTALTALAALLVVLTPARTQQSSSAQSGPAGTEYYVGFMQNDDGGALLRFMGLMITSQVATVGTIEIPGQEPRSFSTQPGVVTTIPIPSAFEHTISEDTIGDEPKNIVAAIHITSRAPVNVFVMNARNQSGAGYAATPVSNWGTRYLPLTLPNALGNRTSELMIVAAHDDTWIQFTPSTKTVRQDQGIPRQIKLNRGRTYFVQAFAGAAGVADLSGSEIISNKPIGVIAGHVRTPVTLTGALPSDAQAYATHHAAMLLPDSAWGSEFATVPMRTSGDRFRIITSREAQVIVTHHGPAGVGRDTLALDAGEVRDVASVDGQPLAGPVHWESSSPAMLMQLRTSGRFGNPVESPAMLAVTPIGALVRRTAFVAVDQIAGAPFVTHTVTLVARIPAKLHDNPAAAFAAILLDGAPIDQFIAGGEPVQIGSTDLFHAKVRVASGAHTLVSTSSVAFLGYVEGDNGSISRDAYMWNLPTWGEPAELDVDAPYVVDVATLDKGTIRAEISDRSERYFSGVGDARPTSASPGWTLASFNAPLPDENGVATFRAIADPSGPLVVTLRDRDGNAKDTTLSESVCFKTATAADATLKIVTTLGASRSVETILSANSCGAEAHVNSITFGSGSVALRLTATFDNGTSKTTIAPFDRARLILTADATVPEGTHQTTMRIAVDDSTITIPVEVVVGPMTGIDDDALASGALRVYPNPVTATATIDLLRPLGPGATIAIVDNLGRTVRSYGADEIAGRSRIIWDTRNDDGAPVAAGIYLLRLVDRDARAVTGITVVR